MSDRIDSLSDNCSRFEEWLLRGPRDDEVSIWQEHLDACPTCREQWTTHRLLLAAFAEEPLPRLSSAFQAGLGRKLAAEIATEIKVEPLSGWRLAAMFGYAAAAVALMAWILGKFPLPQLDIDYSSPWAFSVAMALVPFSLWMAAAASRLLPSPRTKGHGLLTL